MTDDGLPGLESLAAKVEGVVCAPGDAGYDEYRTLWNDMIDKRPGAILRCRTADDVVAGLEYAREQGIGVTAKGGGHSVPGLSLCDGGLVIDLGDMKAISVDPASGTARVEGGALLRDLDAATQEHGLATPAGAVSHTGVAGLALGGGYGHLMRKFGLTVDNMLGMDVVLADGRKLRVDAENEPDLFWALRGGGGNFGVVTEFTFKAHPVGPPLIGIAMHSLDIAAPALETWRDVMADAREELNWSCYLRIAEGFPDIPEELQGRPVVMSLIEWHGDHGEGGPVVDGILERIGGEMQAKMALPFVALQSFVDHIQPHGIRAWTKSGFLSVIDSDVIASLLDAAAKTPSWRSAIELQPLGSAIDRVAEDETAFPHRSARFVFNVLGVWDEPEQDADNIAWVRETYSALEPVMSAGAYINYMSGEEGGAGAAYGQGVHMVRLRAIKRRYDPENLFRYGYDLT